MKRLLVRLIPLGAFAPLLALAQAGNMGEAKTFLTNIVTFINGTLIPLIFALAFLVFLWGMFKTFILGGADEGKQAEGKQLMLYAVVGFVVMLSLWGIVNLLASSFGFEGDKIELPETISL